MVILQASLLAVKAQETKFKICNGLPVIELTVNGVKGDFIIDTGSNASALDIDFAKKALVILENEDVQINGLGGEVIGYDVVGAKTHFMGSRIKMNFKAIKIKTLNVDGIVGSDFLADNMVVLDYKNKTIKTNRAR